MDFWIGTWCRTFRKFHYAAYIGIVLACGCTEVIAQRLTSDPHLKHLAPSAADEKKPWNQQHPQHYAATLAHGVKQADLRKQDIEVLRVLSHDVVVVRLSQSRIGRTAHLFSEIAPVNYLWKLHQSVSDVRPEGKTLYTIKATNPSALIRKFSLVKGIEIVRTQKEILMVRCTYDVLLKSIITQEEVIYAGVESNKAVEESRVLDLNLGPNTVNRVHHEFPALDGSGITLSIRELRYNPFDLDLIGRDIPSPVSATELSNHATDMATIAAGAGNSYITGKGVAWAANLTSSSFDNLTPDADALYEDLEVSVQNHSYGTEIENLYGALAEAYDENTNRLQDLLHVFSSGNKGTSPSSGPYQGITGFANLTGNFKMSKNTLTVGSVDTVGRPVSFSSRGPAYDGRIKPELVAYSTAGSSNSAALVSGIAVLMQQAYRNQYGVLPPSALLKALLINSARDVHTPGPDFETGFGNADAYRTLKNLEAENYWTGNIGHNEAETYTLTIPANATNLKVTLVWNDPAADAGAGVALVNDLDLSIVDEGSTIHLPLVPDSAPDIAKLALPATARTDHRNNVEQVTIAQPDAGDYTITIRGFDVPDGPQLFYIVWQWDTRDTFAWSFPTASDNMPYNGETPGYFQWHSTLATATGKLEYTIDDGDTWELIADDVDLAKGLLRWNAPDTNARARARMVVGTDVYATDNFTISRPTIMRVGFNCSDSVMLQWNKADHATHYKLFTFDETKMLEVLFTPDTSVIFLKSELLSSYFAVQPVLADGTPIIRSLTYNYELLSSGCFITAFYSLKAEDGIELLAQLGTTYGVKEVRIERELDGVFIEIGVVEPQSTLVSFIDHEPLQGLNIYRARIVLANGEEVISESTSIWYLTTVQAIVFPNPVYRTDVLNVYTKEFQTKPPIFVLYNRDGREVRRVELATSAGAVFTGDLNAGLYFYKVITEEGKVDGKIVIAD